MNLIPWRNKQEESTGGGAAETSLARFRDEMTGLFDRFFRDPWGTSMLESVPARFGWGPRIDLAESEDAVIVTAEMPGVDPKEVDLNVTGNLLTIRGQKKQEKEEKGRNYHYVERHYGAFQRAIQLPSSVNPDKVDAAFKNGILTVTLAKRADAKPKRITVRNA
jgi:HSP20 family protein